VRSVSWRIDLVDLPPCRVARFDKVRTSSRATAYGTVNHQIGDAELEKRRKDWRPRKTNFGSGALWKYVQMVGPAVSGAVTHGGALNETNVYADI
jgi:hypothetical protein